VTAAADTIVRMGELAVSADPAAHLVTIGLGSCIGVVIVDRLRRVAGLAHVMLPQARAGHAEALAASARGKYADLAVPALVDAMLAAGARRLGLQVALVGGARMFGAGSGTLDVGARNEAAVRDALTVARLRVRAAATGGGKGRTVRVGVGSGQVLVRMAQRADELLMEASA
jgi:chemotaxis protein CheD